MWPPNRKKIEEMVGTGLVLDIGGWGDPFPRADYVIDLFPYETRGIATHGIHTLPLTTVYPEPLPGEHFRKTSWVIHDVCSERPFPFPDKMFDFVVCSHVLEDVRDPLRVCAEMIRVGRAGYIETPSRIGESVLWNGMVGAAHHRWLVEAVGQRLRFRMKHHFLHSSPQYYISTSFARKIPAEARYLYFFWEHAFEYEEITGYEYYGETADFISRLHISRYYYILDWLRQIKSAGIQVFCDLMQRSRQAVCPSVSQVTQETWTWEKLFEANQQWLQRS